MCSVQCALALSVNTGHPTVAEWLAWIWDLADKWLGFVQKSGTMGRLAGCVCCILLNLDQNSGGQMNCYIWLTRFYGSFKGFILAHPIKPYYSPLQLHDGTNSSPDPAHVCHMMVDSVNQLVELARQGHAPGRAISNLPYVIHILTFEEYLIESAVGPAAGQT